MDGYRFYYDKSYEYILEEELLNHNEYIAKRRAKKRLRMYANLFNRDMRKMLITNESICRICGTKEDLEVDHIIAIANGGKNELGNLQVLCAMHNLKKRANNE